MRVKICGVTSPADARMTEQAGADAIGLMFVPESPRYLSLETAATVREAVGPMTTVVGVFRDAPLRQVLDAVRELRLGAVQLHGQEDEAYAAAVMEAAPVVRALSYRPGLTREALAALTADAVLLDGARPGSGQAFAWQAAAELREFPRLILAGGLTPSNVASGIDLLKPYGVDVSSGVESTPGIKDAALVREFVAAARGRRSEAVG